VPEIEARPFNSKPGTLLTDLLQNHKKAYEVFYSSFYRFWPLSLMAEPSMRTTEGGKRKEAVKFSPFPPLSSLPLLPANF
jgi:hypothetical protein